MLVVYNGCFIVFFITCCPILAYRKRGFNVQSFGSGSHVKLPGSAPDKPNIYSFGKTTYDEMYRELFKKDAYLYPSYSINLLISKVKRKLSAGKEHRNRRIIIGLAKATWCRRCFRNGATTLNALVL